MMTQHIKLDKGESMKYRLKKDLPFAKAGVEVLLENNIVTLHPFPELRIAVPVEDRFKQYSFRFIGYEADIPRLISDGWIEEIKPREGWLGEDNDGGYKFYIHPKPVINHWDKVTKWIEVQE